MASDNIYLLTALPPLTESGSKPPLSLAELRAHVADSPTVALVDAVLIGDDLLLREAALSGEAEASELPDPSVLGADQVRGRELLPDYLDGDEGGDGSARFATDQLQARYFAHVGQFARRGGSQLLGAWQRFELGLRNALVGHRARTLGLDAASYQVAGDLVEPDPAIDAIVAQWAAAPDPLAGLQVLDHARLAWLDERDPSYSFADDELVAYALRLLWITRAWRLRQTSEGADPAGWTPGPAREGQMANRQGQEGLQL